MPARVSASTLSVRAYHLPVAEPRLSLMPADPSGPLKTRELSKLLALQIIR
jgi:hypothetical protein